MMHKKITPKELFLTFTTLSLSGFGGVAPWVYATIVDKKKWMTKEEFTELLAIGQILPGANVTNFSAMFGYRVCGWYGVIASMTGLLFCPFLIIISLGVLYKHYGNLLILQGALKGILAVATGLILLTGIKLMTAIDKMKRTLFFCLCSIILVTFFNWPLQIVVLGL